MKHWRGFIAAGIFGAISAALVAFAKGHPVLIDMVYPYLSRIFTNGMADLTGGTTALVWQILLLVWILVIIGTGVLTFFTKKSPLQWAGWVLASVMLVNMLSTASYSLNAYASPMADDISLKISDYTVSELNEATVYFRDNANKLAETLPRNGKGKVDNGAFEDLAAVAKAGFDVLTYDHALSIFAGSDAPVKKLGMPWLFTGKGQSGVTFTLTGESAVNPRVPAGAMPYAICKELSRRASIYSEADTNFTAFLACVANPDPRYQYSGYLMAYYYCHAAIADIPTSTAQACAQATESGVSAQMRADLEDVLDFYGEAETTANVQATANIVAPDNQTTLISFSSYTDVADLFASWYIQRHILPRQQTEDANKEFDPLDETQVDLSGIVNAKPNE